MRRVLLAIAVSYVLMQDASRPARSATERSVVVSVKSFIARMGPAPDKRKVPPSEATKKALGFEQDNLNRSFALAFMYLTDDNFSENPQTPDSNVPDFRLSSSVKITGACDAGGNVSMWYASTLDTKFGKEGPLDAQGLVMAPLVLTANGGVVAPTAAKRGPPTKSIGLTYAVKGRPNVATMAAFVGIRPRACTWIWHRVAATATCSGGKLNAKATIEGSAFPSARAWTDDKLDQSIAQGPFEDLWECDAGDHTLVR